jgi:hypothetical protein
MNNYLPPRPSGSNPQSRFNQWVWDRLANYIQFINSSTVKFSQTSKGIIAQVDVGQPGSASGRVGPFQIDTVQDDYLTCFPYDNSTQARVAGAAAVYIAKEDKHQTDLASETIFGVVHNYTYTAGTTPPGGLAATDINNKFRTDSVTGEFQLITPPWLCGATGDIIYADVTPGLAVDGPAGPVTLLISGRSAQWSQVTS